jgi:hypothetical protein
VHDFAGAVGRSGDGDVHDYFVGFEQLQSLFIDTDFYEKGVWLHGGIIESGWIDINSWVSNSSFWLSLPEYSENKHKGEENHLG